MSDLTCLCTDPIQSLANEKCSAQDYGNQIVKVFIQKETGTDFDSTAGNDVTVLADWQTRLAADNDDRIAVFGNLASAERASADPNKEENNDVPYGGQEIIDRPQAITAMMKYLSQDDFNKANQIACWGLNRMWFLDNNDWLWAANTSTGAGVAGVSVTTGTFQQMGIGTKDKMPINFNWNGVCQPVPVAKLSFLRTVEGSNDSGSIL